MKTYTALIKAVANGSYRTVKAEIRASNSQDAKWLFQAIYGFHALVSSPTITNEDMKIYEIISIKTPEQQKLDSLKASKERAAKALQSERDRQKRSKAMKSLASLTRMHPPIATTSK